MRRRIHHAWIVLASSMLLTVISNGARFAFGVMIDPLVLMHGWSRGLISLAYSLQFISSAAVGPVFGSLADRHGSRVILIIASIGAAAGIVLTSTISSLWEFYLYYGVLFGAFGSLFSILLPVTVTLWFERRRGLAVGLIWVSSSIGPVVFSPLLSFLIWGRGWGDAFLYVGALGGVAMVLASLLVRSRPEDVGRSVYGGVGSRGGEASSRASVHISLQEIRRTRPYLHLINIHFLGCVGHSILLAHSVSIAIHAGIPFMYAALIISLYAGSSAPSRFLMPILTERFGARKVMTFALVLQGVGASILFWASDIWTFYLFAVVFGIGYGGEMVTFPVVNRIFYGRGAPLNTLHAHQVSGGSIGMALGGWIGGLFFDLTGTYIWSIGVSALASYLGLTSVLALPRHKPDREALVFN